MFVEFNTKNLHISYPEVTRHWSPKSETYAGGDCVLTAIDRGWQFHDVVGFELYWLGGGRYNSVYHFRIRKGDVEFNMPVISTPFVERLISHGNFQLVDQKELEQAIEAVNDSAN